MFKPYADSLEFSDATVVYPSEFYRRHQSTDWIPFVADACKYYLEDENANDLVTIVEAMSNSEEGYNPTDEEVEAWAEELLEIVEDEDEDEDEDVWDEDDATAYAMDCQERREAMRMDW